MINIYGRATGRAAKAAQKALQLAEDIKHAMQHSEAAREETRGRLAAYLAEQPVREQQLQHVSELLRCAIRMMEEEAPHQSAGIATARNGYSREVSDDLIDHEAARMQRDGITFATCIAEVNVLCSILEHSNREAQALLDEVALPRWRDSSIL